MPNSTSTDEVANKKILVCEDAVIVSSDNEQGHVISSDVVFTKSNESIKTDLNEKTEVVANVVIQKDSKKESKVDDDYEYVDSEEYEIEGISGDEYGSHDSQEENDRESGDGEEVHQVVFFPKMHLHLVLF